MQPGSWSAKRRRAATATAGIERQTSRWVALTATVIQTWVLLVNREHLNKVKSLIEKRAKEGASIALDGVEKLPQPKPTKASSCSLTIFDHVKPEMTINKEEIFGSGTVGVAAKTLEDAIEVGKKRPTETVPSSIQTRIVLPESSSATPMPVLIGVNVGVPAPMAWFPFTGWNNSFFGDSYIQGSEGTHSPQICAKMTMTRWFELKNASFQDPNLETQELRRKYSSKFAIGETRSSTQQPGDLTGAAN
ncbi:MAG: aldehyde dehydrogenase family protein [Candidatus Obscuribacter sp.]|nr:aldehyde dehydrogenase family protein [Candidatus Obscuribacter sp.]